MVTDLKQLYTRTMVESIRNSGMWLKEAKLLEKKGSSSHAQALLIFSVEELGKAILCWYAISGILPYNHPSIDYRAKRKDKLKGIFRSHPLKFATALSLELGFRTPELFSADTINPEVTDPFSNAPAPLAEVLSKIGSFGSWARTRWMYVDIDVENDEPKVHNPLLIEPEQIKEAIESAEIALGKFKEMARTMSLAEEFIEWAKKVRIELAEIDSDFPANPEW